MLISSNRHEWVFQIVLWMNKLLLVCFVSPRVNYIGKCFCLGNKAHIFLQISLRYFNLSQDHFIQRRAIFSSFILNIHEFLGITVPNWEFLLGGLRIGISFWLAHVLFFVWLRIKLYFWCSSCFKVAFDLIFCPCLDLLSTWKTFFQYFHDFNLTFAFSHLIQMIFWWYG